jgi:hypothetical protein
LAPGGLIDWSQGHVLVPGPERGGRRQVVVGAGGGWPSGARAVLPCYIVYCVAWRFPPWSGFDYSKVLITLAAVTVATMADGRGSVAAASINRCTVTVELCFFIGGVSHAL